MKTLRVHALLPGLILLGGSCKKKEDEVAPATCNDITRLATVYSNSITAYTSSPTKANCEAFKVAANNYINAAANCPGVLQADITSARTSIKDIVCQ